MKLITLFLVSNLPNLKTSGVPLMKKLQTSQESRLTVNVLEEWLFLCNVRDTPLAAYFFLYQKVNWES